MYTYVYTHTYISLSLYIYILNKFIFQKRKTTNPFVNIQSFIIQYVFSFLKNELLKWICAREDREADGHDPGHAEDDELAPGAY